MKHLRDLVQQGKLKPGDRLPGERDLAEKLEVSRPTLRAALTSLATIGILESRQGSGTYVTGIDKPAALDPSPLKLMAALRGFSPDEMFEARLALEVATVGLAARHVTAEQQAVLAEELAGLFSAVDDPAEFLAHDVLFHRAVAEASQNRILAALTEMVIGAMFGPRLEAAQPVPDLKEAAEWHQRIYRAIREHNPETAQAAMRDHLSRAHGVWKSGKR
jgi:GntR family transcriptional repressor for pyruvate dehydrogenase complex